MVVSVSSEYADTSISVMRGFLNTGAGFKVFDDNATEDLLMLVPVEQIYAYDKELFCH